MASGKLKLLVYVNKDILGDALLKLPVLPLLRQAFPTHHICWLSGRGSSIYAGSLYPLVQNYLDEIKDDTLLGQSWLEQLQPCPIKEQYDVIIDTQHILKSSMALKRIPHRRFISPAAGFFLSDDKPGNATQYSGNMQQRFMTLIKLASEKNIVLPAFTPALPGEYLDLAERLLPAGGHWVGLAPGAGGVEKIWPLENFIAIARAQLEKNRVPVFFLGPNEVDLYPRLKSAVPTARFPELENDQPEIKGPLLAMALARNLKLAVANDSGIGHVFAVCRTPLVSLFGPSDSKKFAVSYPERINLKASAYGGPDMKNIPAAEVLKAIDQLYE